MVWLECSTLLCTVTTCQVSGWDKTEVSDSGDYSGTHTSPPTSFLCSSFSRQGFLNCMGGKPLRPERKNLIPLTDEYLIRAEEPLLFQLISVWLQWPEAMKEPFNLTGLPLSAVRYRFNCSICYKVYRHTVWCVVWTCTSACVASL